MRAIANNEPGFHSNNLYIFPLMNYTDIYKIDNNLWSSRNEVIFLN